VLAVFADEDLLIGLLVPGSIFGVHDFTALEAFELAVTEGRSFRENHGIPLFEL
jgi:hypothetical protein